MGIPYSVRSLTQLTMTLVDELLTLNFIFTRKFLEGGKEKGLTIRGLLSRVQ